MTRDELVALLDAYFRTQEVRGDDWSEQFAALYPTPYWHEYAEPSYEGHWNGLMVRGDDSVERVVTCVFPSDRIIAGLEPGTLLFSEHPVDLEDEPGFLPLALESFEMMRDRGVSFYHVHAPLDQHPEVAPSRLCALGAGVSRLEEYFPIAEGIPGGAAVIGDSELSLDELGMRLSRFLGPEIPVRTLSRYRDEAGRVSVVAGGGAQPEILAESVARGCQTYVTGGAATKCRLEFVQAEVTRFLRDAEEAEVAVVEGTHYGLEKPPQLAMVDWFRARGVPAEFAPDGPK